MSTLNTDQVLENKIFTPLEIQEIKKIVSEVLESKQNKINKKNKKNRIKILVNINRSKIKQQQN